MNKKIAAIIAGSVAALGSAIIAAPAHAQSASLPVQVTVRPAIFLRTYQDLKFVVSQQDLQGGGSVEKVGTYDEALGTSSLPTTSPGGTPTGTVRKSISELYQVWGGRQSTAITVTASKPTLTSSSSGQLGGNAETVQMVVAQQPTGNFVAPAGKTYFSAPVELDFTFSNPQAVPSGAVYTGGELTISVTTP